MYVSDGLSVLRCGHCNKPFDKQSTLRRHGYYCRSRRTGSVNRPRSCIPCARGKAACDKKKPGCSRCSNRAIECRYPAPEGETRANDIPHEIATPSSLSGPDSAALVLPAADVANSELLGWGELDLSFADFLDGAQTSYMSPSFLQEQGGPASPAFSIPPVPTFAVRSLIHRPKKQPGAQRIATLILHTLKSYPMMMLRHDTLPPFIHPTLVERDDMEPLTNCMSLVQMIKNGVRGSRKFFWKNVKLECERLSEEHLNLGRWELLAAMQALSIYVLIRLEEGETDDNNIDSVLVKGVTLIAQRLTNSDITCHTQCALCNNGLELTWKEWIFRESRRRLAVVYRVVNMLIFFEPAALCDLPTDLIIAPLPARKQLWEAGDEFVWKTESIKDPGPDVAFGLAADGEIVKLDETRLSCSDTWLAYESLDTKSMPRSVARWEEWCSGMDSFGGLVMLAASLIL